jgi:hypothetical protein
LCVLFARCCRYDTIDYDHTLYAFFFVVLCVVGAFIYGSVLSSIDKVGCDALCVVLTVGC